MMFNNEIALRLKGLKTKLEQIENDLTLEEVLTDQQLTIRLEKERKRITPIVEKFDELVFAEQELGTDAPINLPANDLLAKTNKTQSIQNQILDMLIELDKHTQKTTIKIINLSENSDKLFEFLNGAYQSFFNKQKITFEVIDFKSTKKISNEITMQVNGESSFDMLCNENGIHKCGGQSVQVIAYPTPEFEIASFDEKDLKIDIYRSNGAGGQNVNKVSTAVRITHLKTGIVATCQDERSQFQNRERALQNLKEKVAKKLNAAFEAEQKKQIKKYLTKNVVRYYDFDKNLITDNKTKMEFDAGNFDIGVLLKMNLIRS